MSAQTTFHRPAVTEPSVRVTPRDGRRTERGTEATRERDASETLEPQWIAAIDAATD